MKTILKDYVSFFADSSGMAIYSALILAVALGSFLAEHPAVLNSKAGTVALYLFAAPAGFYLLGVALVTAKMLLTLIAEIVRRALR